MSKKSDVIVIGGGVIGLATALELREKGLSVVLYDSGEAGQASWAAGGILSPLPPESIEPQLRSLLDDSLTRYPAWCEYLRECSGIDSQFWRCGLRLIPENRLLPDIAQVRPPRLLAALRRTLELKGVSFVQQRVTAAECITKGTTVLAAGAWSAGLVPELAVKPLKGQMLLLRGRPGLLEHMILGGDTYLVPRRDGRILVGSTLEDAGFDTTPTCAARVHLMREAARLWPPAASLPIEQQWAGLRPAAAAPYIGASAIPGLFLNTGHFRLGLSFAPASAAQLAQSVMQST